MMMGEYEYEELLSPDENGKRAFLPITSRIVFFIFILLASIVLINLMIGLAVNDIQALEKEVGITHNARIIHFFLFDEKNACSTRHVKYIRSTLN